MFVKCDQVQTYVRMSEFSKVCVGFSLKKKPRNKRRFYVACSKHDRENWLIDRFIGLKLNPDESVTAQAKKGKSAMANLFRL